MRQKFLLCIASFLLVSIAMSSCLDSDTTYETSTDPTVHAFGLDTILGVDYVFSIDQVNRLIYNIDSLPVGSDTIIDSILIDTFTVTGYVTSGDLDTVLNISNYQDLSGAALGDGLRFRVHAADLVTYRDYYLKINIHQQDPDSLQWSQPATLPVLSTVGRRLKAVTWEGDLLIYFYDGVEQIMAYRTPAHTFGAWEEVAVGLPVDADMASVVKAGNAGSLGTALYVATETGDVYSSTDGVAWSLEDGLSGSVVTLVGNYVEQLIGLVTDESGVTWFAEAASDQSGWTVREEAPDDFPRKNLYSTTFQTSNLLRQMMVVGYATGERIIPWAYDGTTWAAMDPTTSYDTYCLTSVLGYYPAIVYQGGDFYMVGERLRGIYTSSAGLAWYETEEKVMLPSISDIGYGVGVNYSLAVDEENYIYLVASSTDFSYYNVWRGRINRLGFAIQ